MLEPLVMLVQLEHLVPVGHLDLLERREQRETGELL